MLNGREVRSYTTTQLIPSLHGVKWLSLSHSRYATLNNFALLYSTLLYPHDFRTPTKGLPKRQAVLAPRTYYD